MEPKRIHWNQPAGNNRWSVVKAGQLRAITNPRYTSSNDFIFDPLIHPDLTKLLCDHTFLITTSQSGHIYSSSQSEWAGYPIQEWVNSKRSIFQILSANPSLTETLTARWQVWLKRGGTPIRIWFQGIDPKQPRLPIEIKIASFYPKGNIDGNHVLLVVKDLTAEWEQRQRWRSKIQLYRKQSTDSELDFAAWLHDWKNPLGTIESSIWLCLRYQEEKDREKRTTHLKKMERAVQEMKIGMQDWQTWHQPPSLRSIQRVPILTLIRERIEQLKPILKPGQDIQFWSQGKKEIHTDPQAIEHVLDNILSNASKYSPDHSTIWVRAWNQTDRLQIDIRDEGIGIPPTEVDRLFEPRFRATNARDLPGNGLGLSTVDRLVKQLGGTIQVTSQQNSGTTISITLKNQHKSYEENSDHRGQPRNPFQHRRDPGIGTVSNANRREREGRAGNGHSIPT